MRSVSSRLRLLTAAGVVGICVRRNDTLFVAVFEQNHPVRLVIAVRFSHAVCIGQTGAVAVRVIGICGLLPATLADRGQPVQYVIGVRNVLDSAVRGHLETGPVARKVVSVLLCVTAGELPDGDWRAVFCPHPGQKTTEGT